MKSGRRPRPLSRRFAPRPTESRGTEAVTVAWALVAVSLLVANLVWGATAWFAGVHPDFVGIRLLANVASASALILGTLCLVLTPLVMRLRRTPPPIGFVTYAIVVSLVPWVAFALRAGR